MRGALKVEITSVMNNGPNDEEDDDKVRFICIVYSKQRRFYWAHKFL
jgi:hypothetical protein